MRHLFHDCQSPEMAVVRSAVSNIGRNQRFFGSSCTLWCQHILDSNRGIGKPGRTLRGLFIAATRFPIPSGTVSIGWFERRWQEHSLNGAFATRSFCARLRASGRTQGPAPAASGLQQARGRWPSTVREKSSGREWNVPPRPGNKTNVFDMSCWW